jgi:hypothetical protein
MLVFDIMENINLISTDIGLTKYFFGLKPIYVLKKYLLLQL